MNNETTEQYSIHPPDQSTKVAHLGFRALYTLLAWIALGQGFTEGGSYFVSLSLFVTPLLMDYLKFVPDNKVRKRLKKAGIGLSAVWFIIGLVGMFGILSIIQVHDEYYVVISKNFVPLKGAIFSVGWIWWPILLNIFLTGFDWVYYESDYEKFSKEQLVQNASQ